MYPSDTTGPMMFSSPNILQQQSAPGLQGLLGHSLQFGVIGLTLQGGMQARAAVTRGAKCALSLCFGTYLTMCRCSQSNHDECRWPKAFISIALIARAACIIERKMSLFMLLDLIKHIML